MENASKALLMAAGVLMALLTISLLVIMFRSISETQKNSNVDIAEQTTTEFNNQFSTYNNERVRGSDLYSCLNRALDYNKRETAETTDTKHNARGSEYKGITIIVNIPDYRELWWTDSGSTPKVFTNHIFSESDYYLNGNNDNNFERLLGEIVKGERKNGIVQTLESRYNKQILTKLTIEISNIFSGPIQAPSDETEIQKQKRIETNIDKLKKFESIVKDPKIDPYKFTAYTKEDDYRDKNSIVESNLNMIRNNGDLYNDVAEYYEYVQFKRAIFQCEECNYDKNTGRIVKMKFTFTGKFN